MNNSGKKLLTEQHHIPVVGEFKQLLGGAMSWATMFMFVFTGIAAWNTNTLSEIRNYLPWLNLGVFAVIIAAGLIFMMWLEHKWFQPSVMAYWNKMNYNQNNPQKEDHERTEAKVDLLLTYLSKKDPDLDAEYKRLLDELAKKKD